MTNRSPIEREEVSTPIRASDIYNVRAGILAHVTFDTPEQVVSYMIVSGNFPPESITLNEETGRNDPFNQYTYEGDESQVGLVHKDDGDTYSMSGWGVFLFCHSLSG